MIGHEFPYLDTRDLNLDWLLKNMKQILQDWATYQQNMNQSFADLEAANAQFKTDITTAFNNLHDYVEDYFDNLDVQQEINNKLDAMKLSGELAEIMEPLIASETADWLAEHITNPSSPPVDTSLSVSGAAADAKVTGDKVAYLNGAVDGVADAVDAYKVKNFLDPNILAGIKYANLDVYTVSNNSVTGNLTDSNVISDPMFTLPAGTYTVSLTNPCRIQVFANGTSVLDVSNTRTGTFTLTEEKGIYIKFIAGSYPYTFGYIQIERGTTATAFTPYTEPVYYCNLNTKVNNIISAERNMSTFENRVSGEYENQGTVEAGVLRYTDNTIIQIGYHSTISVNAGDQLYFSGFCYNNAFPAVILLYENSVINGVYKKQGNYYGNMIIPSYVDTIVVNGNTENVCVAKVGNSGADNEGVPVKQYVDNSITEKTVPSALKGKTIVWFGTSIPAGGYIGADITRNYPTYIANRYGCTVHNEAIGSSCAHCKELNVISESNPYGFNPNFELSSRCLSNTEDEMQWIIDHFSASFWTNKPGSLPPATQAEILSFSYETKLDKYLTDETFPDLFVFDHGYNDYIATVDNYTGHEYEPYTFQGAMNFLIRRIYSYRPDAKIIMIGNYKYQTRDGLVVEAQKAVAQRWDIPLFNNWHYTGLATEQVYCDFTWSRQGGEWVQVPAAEHLETLTNVLLPDGVHPHSRPDDLIINRMANAIGAWLAVNATDDN